MQKKRGERKKECHETSTNELYTCGVTALLSPELVERGREREKEREREREREPHTQTT